MATLESASDIHLTTRDPAEFTDSTEVKKNCKELIDKWLASSKSIEVLIAGKPGTGKSTLVNGIIGKPVAKVGAALNSKTSKVRAYSLKVNDVSCTIYDTPGLSEHSIDKSKYISDFQKKCKKIDLFIYCIKMSEVRLLAGGDDCNAMKLITQALGSEIWTNGIIVFTFANEAESLIETKCSASGDIVRLFSSRFQKMRLKVIHLLTTEIEIDGSVAETVEFIPASCKESPLLPAINDTLAQNCGNTYHWLSYLWLKAVLRTKSQAQPTLIKLNLHRLRKFDDGYASNRQTGYLISELADSTLYVCTEWGAWVGSMYRGESSARMGRTLGEEIGKTKKSEIVSELLGSMFETPP